jgi:hypothetical protein
MCLLYVCNDVKVTYDEVKVDRFSSKACFWTFTYKDRKQKILIINVQLQLTYSIYIYILIKCINSSCMCFVVIVKVVEIVFIEKLMSMIYS